MNHDYRDSKNSLDFENHIKNHGNPQNHENRGSEPQKAPLLIPPLIRGDAEGRGDHRERAVLEQRRHQAAGSAFHRPLPTV